VIHVEAAVTLGEYARGQVGDRDSQMRVAEVDPDRGAGSRLQGQQDAWAPAPGARAAPIALGLGFGDHARSVQLRHQRRHGGPRKAREPGDVRAARRALTTEDVDHLRPVALAERAKCALA